MDAAARQTKLGQAGLLIAAFSTPFAVMAGTGGYTHAQPVETTGNSMFVTGAYQPTNEQINTALFVKALEKLAEDYQLSRNLISALLGVSRPTIYSWLDGSTENIRAKHRQRLADILTSFDQNIDEDLRPLVGKLLRKRLDTTVSKLLVLTQQTEFSKKEVDSTLKTLNFKLSGITRSNQLSEALKNKNPLI